MQKKKWWIKGNGEKIFLASPLMKCKLFQRNLENWMQYKNKVSDEMWRKFYTRKK